MRNTILAILLAATVAAANPPAPFPVVVDSQSRSVPSLEIYQAEARTFRVMFRDNGAGSNVSGVSPYLWWATDASATQFVTSVWARVNGGTTGCVDFTFSASAVNTNGDLIYGVGAGATYRQGALRIIANPYTAGVAAPVFTTNANLAGVSFSNYPWPDGASFSEGTTNSAALIGNTLHVSFKTNYADIASGTSGVYTVQSTNSRVTVANGTGPTVSLGFDATGLATGDFVRAETDAAAIAQVGTASNALRVSIGLGSSNLTAFGLAYSNAAAAQANSNAAFSSQMSTLATGPVLYVETDSTALAQLATASNSLRLGIGLVASNLTTETANSVAASNALQSSIGLVNTNSLARDSGISNTIAALGATYVTRGSNLSDLASAATARSNLGLGTAATNAHASAVWNADSIQGVAASTQRVELSLFSSGTGNSAAFRSVGGAIAPPSMSSTQIVFAIAQGVIGDSNLNASVSNAFQTSTAAGTNNARVLALETGRAYEVSYRVTSAQVANVAGDYVSRTSRTAQTVASDVTVYGGATVYSNLYVHTDALSSELLSNGGFATDTAWVKGGSIYHDSGRYVVNDGLSGSLAPSGSVSVSAGGLYRVGYVLNGSATGTVTVTLGGATNAYAYALAGTAVTNVIRLATTTASNPVLAFATSAGQVSVDDFTAKRYADGDLFVADSINAGGYIIAARYRSTWNVVSNDAVASTAIGGTNNIAGGVFSTVAGGSDNKASGIGAFAGGGQNNVASGLESVNAGGANNTASGDFSANGGGSGNTASEMYAANGGGGNNSASGAYSANGGGRQNFASGAYSANDGGLYNFASGDYSANGGGRQNSASGMYAANGGGYGNTSSAPYSVTVAGFYNLASGTNSLAAGRQARAEHNGAFVMSDSQASDFASTNADSFNLRFQGGLRFVDGTNVLIINDGSAALNGVSMTQAGSVTALTEFATGSTTMRPARVSLYSGGTLATSTTSGAEMSLYLTGGGSGATGSPLYEVTGAGAVSVTTSGQSVNVYAASPVQTGQVNSIAGLQGAVTLTAGSGVNITTSGQAVAFAATGSFVTDANGANLTNANTIIATNFIGNGSGITGVDAVTVNGVTIEAAITNNLALLGAAPISVNTVVGGDIATATVSIVGNPLMLASNNAASVGTTNDMWALTIRSGLWMAGNTGAGLLAAGSVAFGTGNVISSTSGGNIVAGGVGGANTLSGITKDSVAVGNTLTINARSANAVFGYGNEVLGGGSDGSFIGGGTQNKTYTGIGGVMPASIYSISSNAYALAGGSGAVAQHLGSFVWADRRNDGSSDATRFKSTATNQFLVRADTVAFGTNVAVNAARLTVAGDVSVATVGQRFWLSTNEYIVGTGTGKVFIVSLNPASTNSL